MNHLKIFFKKQLQAQIPKWIIITLIVVALAGFADASFLTIEHYANKIPPCSIGSCETVLTSVYAVVAGIPVSLAGALYYLALLVLFIVYLDTKKEMVLRIAFYLTTLGFIVSVYFFILQAMVLHAFCQYCLVSAGTSTLLFILAIHTLFKYRKEETII